MDWTIENEIVADEELSVRKCRICGTDEAGRGPLAGDVYAAAVILPHGLVIEGLRDSKNLTPGRREYLYGIICEKAVAYAVCSVSAGVIDRINILNASVSAMRSACESIEKYCDYILIDGNCDRGFTFPHRCIVKGDQKSPNIAAASVLAKVERDRYMSEIDEIYPEYGFARHKGYPTKEHVAAILKYGAAPLHRRTFLRKIAQRYNVSF